MDWMLWNIPFKRRYQWTGQRRYNNTSDVAKIVSPCVSRRSFIGARVEVEVGRVERLVLRACCLLVYLRGCNSYFIGVMSWDTKDK